jgi:hypothetical protein
MSRAPVVDERYRLQPVDLAGAPLRVVITSVSHQGLEEITPLLHFATSPVKPLALDFTQRRELIRLARSSVFADWIGRTVELRVTTVAGKRSIVITDPTPSKVVRERVARLGSSLRLNWSTVLLIVLLVLVFTALYILENSPTAWSLLLDLLR